MKTPGELTMRADRVVVRAHDRDVMPGRQRFAELGRVDLRPGAVPGKKVVDGMQDAQRPAGSARVHRPNYRAILFSPLTTSTSPSPPLP